MAMGMSNEAIRSAGRRAVAKFVKDLHGRLPGSVVDKHFLYVGKRRVEVLPRVIRASNGEMALWPMAVVYDEYNNILKALSEAPWMPDGCDVEAVFDVLRGG